MLDYIVYIGRFQPFHNAHKAVIDDALTKAKKVIVLIGGDGAPRTVRDPFNYPERSRMVLAEFNHGETDTVFTQPIKDFIYNDDFWIMGVKEAVENAIWSQGWTDKTPSVGLLVNEDDLSGYNGLNFPEWEIVELKELPGMVHATVIREKLFSGELINGYIPRSTRCRVDTLLSTSVEAGGAAEDFQELKEQYDYIKDYNKPYKDLPYPPIFQTVDAMVLYDNKILLVKRKGVLGKDLWALPGGFVDADETLFNACIRELQEETNVDIAYEDLKKAAGDVGVFDDPHRSCLGRVITTTIIFNPTKEVNVVAGDDAAEVRWWPVKSITRNMMHDDHYYIIQEMIR